MVPIPDHMRSHDRIRSIGTPRIGMSLPVSCWSHARFVGLQNCPWIGAPLLTQTNASAGRFPGILVATLLPLLLWPCHSLGQAPAGTTLVHYGQVDDGVYKGSKPKTNADFEFLQSLHIKYIVDLQFFAFLHRSERKKAERYGIVFIPARMNASFISPSQKHVESILAILRDNRHQPVYFHCALGRDRTSLIAALYEMYFLGMSQPDGWRYLRESGYKDSWVRSGLTRYLKKHPAPPTALVSP
jgi:protein-tyrosine phosphatase